MREKTAAILYFTLPAVLFPLSFIVFKGVFIYAILLTSVALAAFSAYRFRKYIFWMRRGKVLQTIAIGVAAAIALYAIFVLGHYGLSAIGIGGAVSQVYGTIYSGASKYILVPVLLVIGVCEEVYWRGGLQGYIGKKAKGAFMAIPWVVTTAYYTAVHISSLSIVLVGAAFFIGIITGIVAKRYGILASIIAHVVWIEAIVVFIPVMH